MQVVLTADALIKFVEDFHQQERSIHVSSVQGFWNICYQIQHDCATVTSTFDIACSVLPQVWHTTPPHMSVVSGTMAAMR